MEQNRETLGKRIMALRKAKGWTQEQLAAQLGISAQAVSKWENDVSCPDISTLPALAALLGVRVDTLLGVPAAGGEAARLFPGSGPANGRRCVPSPFALAAGGLGRGGLCHCPDPFGAVLHIK